MDIDIEKNCLRIKILSLQQWYHDYISQGQLMSISIERCVWCRAVTHSVFCLSIYDKHEIERGICQKNRITAKKVF